MHHGFNLLGAFAFLVGIIGVMAEATDRAGNAWLPWQSVLLGAILMGVGAGLRTLGLILMGIDAGAAVNASRRAQ